MSQNPGELKNIRFDADNHTLFDIQSITNLQAEISNKLARYSNREYNSKRNDLGVCLTGEKNYQKLTQYLDILEDIKYCNSCYCDFSPSEIILAIRKNINRLI